MKLPHDCHAFIEAVHKDGRMRPKTFFHIGIISKELGGMEVCRYVLARDCVWLPFLRIRLWFALLECRRMVRKLKKFKSNQGL